MATKRVGILIFPQVEVLDFCGPFEVFSVTRLDEERRREEPSPFEVLLVAESAEPVVATGGLRVIPDAPIDACAPLHVLVVPGGRGTRSEIKNQRLLEWIADDHFPSAKLGGDTSTRRQIIGLTLRPGDRIRIEGIPDGGEHAPLDYVAFSPSPESP